MDLPPESKRCVLSHLRAPHRQIFPTEFKQDSLLQNPPSGSYNSDADVLATGLHWVSTGRQSQVLAVTYMSHGIA